jgi:hypothetical protein
MPRIPVELHRVALERSGRWEFGVRDRTQGEFAALLVVKPF